MSSNSVDLTVDQFEALPDSLLLLILNRIGDVKALGRCCVVSKRFHSLVPQVDNVIVRVDCVISDDDRSSSKSRSILKSLVSSLIKPLQSLMKRSGGEEASVTHHSPAQVLKNFAELKLLRIELPSGELGIDAGVLLKWRAHFGSTLENCVILGAASVTQTNLKHGPIPSSDQISGDADNGTIPESFYTNGGLKLRVVWTISSLIAASARHYLLHPIIAEHKTLSSLVLTDADGQGVLCMNKEQLEDLRVNPLSASSASKRTLVPALNMRLWYAPHLDLPNGTVFKGATLVAIRPTHHSYKEVAGGDGNLVASAFEEPYFTAAKMLVKRRTYCLQMNSF